MLHWFQRLMPRQELFFPLFERHADVLLAGARALRDMLKGGDTSRRCRDVMAQELKADDITRDVMVAIRTSFITPFDRADIKNLITSMDDAIDQMQQTAKAIVLFEMTSFAPEMQAMTDAVVECAELVQRAVPLLASVGSNASKSCTKRPRAAIPWTSCAATRSMAISKRASIASMTLPTRSKGSLSSTLELGTLDRWPLGHWLFSSASSPLPCYSTS
jgi:uncharacterized protein Yka (UPF0111/DUF47 family)